MTRKKYIKLLTALDVPRNTADAMAKAAQAAGVSYEEDYMSRCRWLQLAQAGRCFARNVVAAVTALVESLRDALPYLQEDDLDSQGGDGHD